MGGTAVCGAASGAGVYAVTGAVVEDWTPGEVGRLWSTKDGGWEIDAEPDVMGRVKGVFPRLKATARGTLTLSGTPEVARDLEWLLLRWPMSLSKADARRLKAGSREHVRIEAVVRDIVAGKSIALPQVQGTWVSPVKPLREHQRQTRDLVWSTGGVLVVDDLGTGKTLCGLSLLERPDARPGLAVTKAGMMTEQWKEKLEEFYPDLTVKVVPNTAERSLDKLLVDGRIPDLLVMNYEKLSKWQYLLKGVVQTVMFDEVQELRHDDTDKYTAAQTLVSGAKYVVGLSATPIHNYGGETFRVMDVLKPHALGTEQEFAVQWTNSNALGAKTCLTDPGQLHTYLVRSGLMQRRDYTAAGVPKPNVVPIEHEVPSDPEVLEKLQGDAVEMARLILDQSARPWARFSTGGQLDLRMRLATGVAKAPFVADVVKLLLEAEPDEKLLLFGHHHEVYGIWRELLADYDPHFYTGAQKTLAQKRRSIDAFRFGDCRVLVWALRSGAGIDGLQGLSSTLVFGELDWSPAIYKQAIGRLGRPGQVRPTNAHFCVSNDGSDPIMRQVNDIKAVQSGQFLDPGFGDVVVSEHEHNSRMKALAADLVARADAATAARELIA